METTQKHPKFVRWAVMLGIVIALNIFFFVARSLILPEPLFEEYCPTRAAQPTTVEACESQNGVWVATTAMDVQPQVKTAPEGYCDLFQKCQPLYDDAHKQYAMYTFVLMIGLGILSIIVGVLPIGSSIVSSGLSYGGVLALLVASIGYWGEAGNLLKLGMSFVALVALIYIGIKRFKD